jgi:hypothetical protein
MPVGKEVSNRVEVVRLDVVANGVFLVWEKGTAINDDSVVVSE